ncbi:MAG: hypothetical protein U5K28_05230 [Halobacteriales archaeon]|nr:hypothetical protein [Halobacteriales archaeon]
MLSPLLLPLPIPIPQIERLKFVVTLVVLFPLSIGLKRALSVDRRYAVVALVVVAVFGGATTFTVLAADDMSETYIDEPREQVTMTDAEYRSIGTAAAFLQAYGDGAAATDQVTNRAFEPVGFNATRPLRARPSGLRTDATYLVVRERWTDHIVALGQGLRSGDLNRFTLFQDRFETADRMRDKVYTTGHVRVYRSEDGFEDIYGTNRYRPVDETPEQGGERVRVWRDSDRPARGTRPRGRTRRPRDRPVRGRCTAACSRSGDTAQRPERAG